jgi:PPIC-type PPIASE domain
VTGAVIRRLLREPLLHFFVLGAALFALYGWLNRGELNSPNEIFVSRGQVQSLQAQFERVWQRPATADELQRLVDNWVREEIFYREGLAMGLDRDDPVVRRRVGQKVEFLIDGAAPPTPGDPDLQAWLEAHPANYQIEPMFSFQQVFFDPQRHGASLEREIAAARRALAEGQPIAGDSTLLPEAMQAAPLSDVQRAFGADFAAAMSDLPVGDWQGPVQSAFGLHFVRLGERVAGHQAVLEEVRARVERDLLNARAQQANETVYQRLRANYRVRVEPA